MATDKVVVSEQDVVTSTKVTNYVAPDALFNEFPSTLIDQIRMLAKIKHSDEIAAGHVSDKELRAFCNSWLRDTVKSLYEQKKKAISERAERKQRDYYLALRADGISVEQASKASGYNPLT